MSGIAKPLATFSNSTTPKAVVNVDYIQSVEAVDIPDLNNNPAEYQLLITSVFPNGATKDSKLKFADVLDRDAAQTALIALAATDCA